MIQNFIQKCKHLLNTINTREDIFIMLIIILVGFGGFGLGRISKINESRAPVSIEYGSNSISSEMTSDVGLSKSSDTVQPNIEPHNMMFVASVNGAKFHFPWCSGAQRIKESNKIWFASKEKAIKAGYSAAKNCKGL